MPGVPATGEPFSLRLRIGSMNVLRSYRAGFVLLLLLLTGCPQPPPPPASNSTPPAPLRVMVVDDAPLAAAVAREWLAHTETKLEIVELTAEKAAAAAHLPVDVVIYPPALLGQFASADFLLPLEERALSEPAFAREEILPELRAVETNWGRRTLAVPLGSPQLVLWYRADLLAQLNLAPPRTWEELSTAIEKFAEKPAELNPETDAWHATAEPLAAGWPSRLLLARAASAALHRDQLSPLWNLDQFEPLIAGPPWVRALEQLVAANCGAADRPLLTPTECCAKFHAGECAFTIGWPGVTADQKPPRLQRDQIGVVALPGSDDVFQPIAQKWEAVAADESIHVPLLSATGRLASVTRASAQPRIAQNFLLWLSGPGVSGRVAPVSSATTVFRTSHLRGGSWQTNAALQSQLAAYGEVLFQEPATGRQFVMPRIPGEHEYLAALDAAVLAALRGEQPPAAALTTAADEWRAIAKSRGIPSQQRALRRSLGLGD